MVRRATSTSAFGVSKRENHDSTAFYARFTPPELSTDAHVHPVKAIDKLLVGDARAMTEVPDSAVALVVTSPPYFAGKEYEATLGEGGVPATYLEYLDLLRAVFAECVRTLEPGGRIAVNVANLGRRPYRSLAADVMGILQDDLRLLVRGEIVWLKQRGATGSCAWGSFQQPTNPVLRDLTERVIVASKGRFDRAIKPREREASGLPFASSMTRDDFMEHTLDVWEIPPESATRVGHPAPFPVELPSRLIDLYTYAGDLVLDPFLGSGSTAVAAVQAGRHYVGYDLDPSYVEAAERRVAAAVPRVGRTAPDALGVAVAEGRSAGDIARLMLEAAGLENVTPDKRAVGADFTAVDAQGRSWMFLVAGSFTTHRPGMATADAVWRCIGRAAVMHEREGASVVVLTAGVPARATALGQSLAAVIGAGRPIAAVVSMPGGVDDLRTLIGS